MRPALALCAALLLAGCGGEGAPRQGDPFKALEQQFDRRPKDERAAPRWERVTAFDGAGRGEHTVTIARDAIQWRAACRGEVVVAVAGAEGPCRRSRTFIGHGAQRVSVRGAGRWRVVVEQQVETPLHEPPLEGMTARRLVAQGRFATIERQSRGRALVYRLPSGRLALRMEGFRTAANTDLYVWLSRARRPRTTREALRAPHRTLRGLKSTVGDQNYLLPAGTRPADLRSIVIWCVPIRIAYTAAPLAMR